MILVLITEEHKSLQIIPQYISIRFLCIKESFLLHYVLISNTLIESSRSRTMLTPFPKAHPAELMLADSTDHVITSIVFFDWLVTALVWAWFCVCKNPSCILTLKLWLLFPGQHLIASTGKMLFFRTLKAELPSAFTNDIIDRHRIRCHGDIVTSFWIRTPFDLSVLFCKTFRYQPLIISKLVFIKDLPPHWLWNL